MADLVTIDTDADHLVAPAAAASLLVLSLPLNAFAVQVGCFVTAVLLGFMFLLSLGITLLLKSQLSCRVGGAQRTPWKCMVFLTASEFFLFVLVFAVTQTNFLTTLVIYLPFAAVLNGFVLKKPLQALASVVPPRKRYLLYILLALSLPAAIQLAGLVWSALTGVIESTEFHS
ncbi:MAG: hypothetical protein OEW15_03320 [Nitrospirota bacterium]|nr:hypothetical protein [Nitrospirota bacterium]